MGWVGRERGGEGVSGVGRVGRKRWSGVGRGKEWVARGGASGWVGGQGG